MKQLMLLIHIISVLVVNCYALVDVDQLWENFKVTYNKTYASRSEEILRQRIYSANIQRINVHNRLNQLGLLSFTLRQNRFTDLLNHEFNYLMNGFLPEEEEILLHSNSSLFIPSVDLELPSSIDWREHGAVTEVKDQGGCNCCYAFSSTGSIEGHHFLKTRELIPLSEQNIVDCSLEFGNNGCSGGLMTNSFNYVIANGGIDTETYYPYEGKLGYCRYNSNYAGAVVFGYKNIPSGNEKVLQYALATVGPVSVGVDATLNTFQFYGNGIYYDPRCRSDKLNHAVLVVGYGSEEGIDYWLVKNSWGPGWGEGGYIKMARNKNNHCGIASMATYPLI